MKDFLIFNPKINAVTLAGRFWLIDACAGAGQ